MSEIYDFIEKEIVGVYDNDTIQLIIEYLIKRKEEIQKQLEEENLGGYIL